MRELEIQRGETWQHAEYPGDDTEGAFAFEYRRFDGRDRLQVAAWEQEQAERFGDLDALALSEWSLDVESEAMAKRLRNVGGETWTTQTLLDLHGRSPAAWQWLSRLLYAPVHEEIDSGARRAKLERRSTLLARQLRVLRATLRLRSAIAETV